jgi:DNA-binding HxlR family transcriptional regulator
MNTANWIIAGAAIVQALATIVLVLVTRKYVKKTSEMAEATKSLAEEEKETRIHQRKKISILKSMMQPSVTYQTTKGITRKTGILHEEVIDLVTELMAEGAVQRQVENKHPEEGYYYYAFGR